MLPTLPHRYFCMLCIPPVVSMRSAKPVSSQPLVGRISKIVPSPDRGPGLRIQWRLFPLCVRIGHHCMSLPRTLLRSAPGERCPFPIVVRSRHHGGHLMSTFGMGSLPKPVSLPRTLLRICPWGTLPLSDCVRVARWPMAQGRSRPPDHQPLQSSSRRPFLFLTARANRLWQTIAFLAAPTNLASRKLFLSSQLAQNFLWQTIQLFAAPDKRHCSSPPRKETKHDLPPISTVWQTIGFPRSPHKWPLADYSFLRSPHKFPLADHSFSRSPH